MKKRIKSFVGLFLLLLLASCAADQLEIAESNTENSEAVWEYNGDSETLQKVIAELKNSENRKPLERRLAKNEVLWKEAKFLLIDNKKRIMVPFLSADKENIIGVLALVKDAHGNTTFDMAVRTRLTSPNNKLPFWNPAIWMGYFMALDKDILGIKNGNPGFKQTIANNKKSKANARIQCDLYEIVTTHCSLSYLYDSATGEMYNFVDRGCTDTYSYTQECYWVPDPVVPIIEPTTDLDGGSGGGGSFPIANSIENRIQNNLDPCPSKVLEDLRNATNNDIAAIFQKLGATQIYNVDMKMGSTLGAYGVTTKAGINSYVITIDGTRYTESTDLFKAAVLIHELIHAYYLSVVDDYNNPTTNLSLRNFSELYKAYEEKKYPGGPSAAQHNQMALDYVNAMASALQEYYYKNNPVDPIIFNNPSYITFTDLAWGTLSEAPIFDEKFKADDPERQRILDRYRTESIGRTVNAGTTNQQKPIGKACN